MDANTLTPRLNELGGVDFVNHDGRIAYQVRAIDDHALDVSAYGTFKTKAGVIHEAQMIVRPRAGNVVTVESQIYTPPPMRVKRPG